MRSVLLVASVLAAQTPLFAPSSADSAFVETGRLPHSLIGNIWMDAGTAMYSIGGFDPDGSREPGVVRYDYASDTAVTVCGQVIDRSTAAAAWTGSHGYIFGGDVGLARTAEILRFDPTTCEVQTMNARLPQGTGYSIARWDGRYVWIFGGYTSAGARNWILRYDPATDSLTTHPAVMPSAGRVPVVRVGSEFIFVPGSSVSRFDPASGTVTTIGTLPSWQADAELRWTGRAVYLFGGEASTRAGPTAEVRVLELSPFRVTLSPIRLPKADFFEASGFAGSEVHLFTDWDDGVYTYDFRPSTPGALSFSFTGQRQVTLGWAFTAAPLEEPPDGFRVRRNGGVVADLTASAARSFVDTYPAGTKSLSYSVATVRAGVEGAAASYPTVSVPSAPAAVYAAEEFSPVVNTQTHSVSIERARVSWSTPTSNGGHTIIEYRVYRNSELAGTVPGTAARVFVDEKCPAPGKCAYRIAAVNVMGEGPAKASNPVQGTYVDLP